MVIMIFFYFMHQAEKALFSFSCVALLYVQNFIQLLKQPLPLHKQ